jgi:CubicO group peptidase (beta-lactamase class C family)
MHRLLILFLLMNLSSCWLVRAYRLRRMHLTDYKKLPAVTIHKPENSYHFIEAAGQTAYADLEVQLDSSLSGTNTAAFLVIRNDSLIYEKYFNDFDKDDILPSNSMAKSFTGTLVRIAFNEGKIRSLSDPMTNYIPELLNHDPDFEKITIQHLLDMRSGFDFTEGRYTLKDDAIKEALKQNLKKQLLKIKIAEPPGRFKYQSINTQFLGWIVERATGQKLYSYFEDKLWKPLGAEHDATWNIDSKSHKQVLASAGINAVPRDFAKLGQLYINKGNWNGRQIIDEEWVHTISSIDTMAKYGGYKNQWWSRTLYQTFEDSLTAVAFQKETPYSVSLRRIQNSYRVNYRTHAFSAVGFLNQYIYVNPEKRIVIVRIGGRWTNSEVFPTQFIYQLGEQL